MNRLATSFSKRISLTSAVCAALLMLTAACSNDNGFKDDKIAPETGSSLTEDQTAATPVDTKAGSTGYISADSVRVRTSPEAASDNAVGRLFTNDKVEVLEAAGKYVQIRILESNSTVDRSLTLYVARDYVSSTPIPVDAAATSALITSAPGPQASGQKPIQTSRLFIVTNIATERLRVYQRCLPGEGCVNRMIMETGVVNGEAKDGTHTDVGFYQVSSWTKFYETPPYPAWYKPGYPDVPKPDNRSAWISSEYMPNGKGDMRGAFGWYTAKVAPNPNAQWTHGTAGWGADKTSFITFKDSFWGKVVNIFTSIRSHGCTRTDNESIAYLRQLISVGTPLIKIYAKEAYRDESRAMYNKVPGRWEYILTKNGHQQVNNHQLADRQAVLRAGTPQSEWLDQGVYSIDQYPDAETSDLYDIGSSGMHGNFLVDEGTLLNYRHPTGIGRGGYSDQVAPPYMYTSNAAISQPKPAWRSSSGRGGRGGDPYGYGDN
jgi:hypothetical protein